MSIAVRAISVVPTSFDVADFCFVDTTSTVMMVPASS
jgi:hypothetical protein